MKTLASQRSILVKLLNDDSFICWINGNATPDEKVKWRRWLLKDPAHQEVMEKARKFLTMPFKINEDKLGKSKQLSQLQEKILKQNRNTEIKKEE